MEILYITLIILILLILIVFACVIFTNAVEHFGCSLNFSQGAIGSILAAVGTALPETILPLVAILGAYIFKTDINVGKEIGIGAILGSPFLLGTLALFVSGLTVYICCYRNKRCPDMSVNIINLKRDLRYFLVLYTIAIMASMVSIYAIKAGIVVILLASYGVFVYRTIIKDSESDVCSNELEPLYLSKWLGSSNKIIILQLVLSTLAIIILARLFVSEIEDLSSIINISPMLLSFIIAPIATELPEKINSVLWIRCNKDTLAIGNITGAMVFQSCIPTSVGILLTPWVLGLKELVSVASVLVSIILLYFLISLHKNILKPWMLIVCGAFYFIYFLYVFIV